MIKQGQKDDLPKDALPTTPL